jgi:hypothetical protein
MRQVENHRAEPRSEVGLLSASRRDAPVLGPVDIHVTNTDGPETSVFDDLM